MADFNPLDDWEEIQNRSARQLNKGDKYVPWGTGLVEGAKDLGSRAVNQLQEWSKEDPDTWTDDLLRLTGRGVKGLGDAMGDWERRSEEGELGIRSAAGTALRFMNWSSEQGARLGRTGARAIGVNEELGGFLGSFLPEAIGTKGLSKVAQVGKTTRQLRKLRKLGARDWQLDAITKGKYAMAYGDKPTSLLGDIKTATTTSKKAQKSLGKLEKSVDDDLIRLIYKDDAARALNPKAKASTRATVTSQSGGVQVYDNFKSHKDVVGRIPKELGGNIGTLSRIEGVPSKQFHHIFMKELAAEYVDKARKLGIDPDEVIELDRIAKRYGFGLGNYEDAAYYADKVPHDLGHDWAIAKGIQPTGKNLQIAKEKIRSTDNIKQLYKDFEASIKELAVPLRDEIELFQEAWDTIPGKDRMKLIQLRWNREALKKTQLNSKAHKTAKNVYSKHKGKLLEQVFERRLNQRRLAENVSELQYDAILEEVYRLGLDKLPPEVAKDALSRAERLMK